MTGLDGFGNLPVWAGVIGFSLWVLRLVRRKFDWRGALIEYESHSKARSPVPFSGEEWDYDTDHWGSSPPIGRLTWLWRALMPAMSGKKEPSIPPGAPVQHLGHIRPHER